LDSNIFGYWISYDYFQEIEKTHNPYIAIKNNPYKILIIKSENQTGDTLKISFDEPGRSEFSGFNFYKIITENSLRYIGHSFWKPSEIKYIESEAHIINFDKIDDLLITKSHSGKETRYKRIPEFEKDKYFDNLRRLINQILLFDRYVLDNKIIEFSEDGKVNGFNDYKSFRLGINFKFDFTLYKNNYIEFLESPTLSKYYNATENLNNRFYFEFDSDSLKLYEIKEEHGNDYRLTKGQLKYNLVKYTP